MFDVPQAKRVRREELYSLSRSPSASPDPELDRLFRKRLDEQYAEAAAPIPEIINTIGDERKSEEVEFRLFAKPLTADDLKITKIRVQSPTVDDGPGGLVNPERPREYYFRDSLSPEAKDRLELAAVSGEEVVGRSRTVWSGCLLPWRVTTIFSTSKWASPASVQTIDQNDLPRKKRRKGKKTRLAIRKKATAARERLEKEQKSAADKELEEKIKRAKRNRDKKLKKRERDKAKKAASKVMEGDVAARSDGESE